MLHECCNRNSHPVTYHPYIASGLCVVTVAFLVVTIGKKELRMREKNNLLLKEFLAINNTYIHTEKGKDFEY